MAASFQLRTFQAEDTDQVVQLWQQCDLLRPWNDPVRDIHRKLGQGAEYFLVAERDGVIVGTAMGGYDGHRGWVNYLAVSPDHRRTGCGRLLLAHLESLLRAQGCPKVNLQIREGNQAAMGFYEACGFGRDAVVSLGKRLIQDAPPCQDLAPNDEDSPAGPTPESSADSRRAK